jgi:hypothetical protein
MADLVMKGDAPMAQEIIVVLLAGLIGVIWVIVLDIFGDDHHPHDNRKENPSPEPHDGEKAHEGSSRQSKVAA